MPVVSLRRRRSSVAAPSLPITVIYNSGSGTETVPTGATNVRIRTWGSGAAGGRGGAPGGGGGGGFVESSYTCSGGQTIIYSVGASVAGRATNGDGANGNDSTVLSGTLSITAMTAGGGFGGFQVIAGGAGGTALGGTTVNEGGRSGEDSPVSTGGAAGDTNSLLAGGGTGSSASPGSGGNGVSSGTSGAGAAGRVEFYYT